VRACVRAWAGALRGGVIPFSRPVLCRLWTWLQHRTLRKKKKLKFAAKKREVWGYIERIFYFISYPFRIMVSADATLIHPYLHISWR
jgi:hypothetical protein